MLNTPCLDIFELLGPDRDRHYKMTHALLEGERVTTTLLPLPEADLQIVYTYPMLLGPLIASGLFDRAPTITRLYAYHEYSYLFPPLHQKSAGYIIENPLTRTLAIEQGLDGEKIHFLPCARALDPVEKADGPLTVGCSTRLCFGKNIEYAIWAFERIRSQVRQARFVLHGSYDASGDLHDGVGYWDKIRTLLNRVGKEPWFTWDNTHYEDPREIYGTFDVGIHLSGAEDPGYSVIEQMSMGIPMLLLGSGNRPSLFGEAALLAKHQGPHNMRRGFTSFFLPDTKDVADKLLRLIEDKNLRQTLSDKGSSHARENLTQPVYKA